MRFSIAAGLDVFRLGRSGRWWLGPRSKGEMSATESREDERLPTVRFVDQDHVIWTVHEIRDPISARGSSLIFVSPDGFRRVRDYPDDWRTLSPAELASLSWNR